MGVTLEEIERRIEKCEKDISTLAAVIVWVTSRGLA